MNVKIENPVGFFGSIKNIFSSSSNDTKNPESSNFPVLNFSLSPNNEDLETGENSENSDNSSLLGKLKTNIKQSVEVQTSYKTFFFVISVGIFFIMTSLLFLPFVALNPQKFLSLFSIGSILILSSFIFIYGTSEYFSMLFSGERFLFSILYLGSIVLGIYSAFIKDLYILSLISVAIQFVSLIFFVLSLIPGGKSGISFLWGMISAPLRRLFTKS